MGQSHLEGVVATRHSPERISYTYDAANRLTGIDYPTGTDVSFPTRMRPCAPQDPLSLHRYLYVRNDPVNYRDATGAAAWSYYWEIIRNIPGAYWQYYVEEPLCWQMCDSRFDKIDCIAQCIRETSLVAGGSGLGPGAILGITLPKQWLVSVGLLETVKGFEGASAYTTVGSLIAHWTSIGGFRRIGRLFHYLNIPIGGWEAGNWARCLGRCM